MLNPRFCSTTKPATIRIEARKSLPMASAVVASTGLSVRLTRLRCNCRVRRNRNQVIAPIMPIWRTGSIRLNIVTCVSTRTTSAAKVRPTIHTSNVTGPDVAETATSSQIFVVASSFPCSLFKTRRNRKSHNRARNAMENTRTTPGIFAGQDL